MLVFSDTHFPYHHPDTFEFLEAVKDKYHPSCTIHAGDITDSYAFSRYPKDPDHDECYTQEFRAVRDCIKKLNSIFPHLTIVKSNHDERLWERAKVSGIPKSIVLPFLEVIGAGDFNWELRDELILKIYGEHWYFTHYRGSNVLTVAERAGMSVLQGHTHTKLNVRSTVTLQGRLWGVDCGCLLGDDRHAFAYNKSSMIRPNLGVILIEGGVPRVIPMSLVCGIWDGNC